MADSHWNVKLLPEFRKNFVEDYERVSTCGAAEVCDVELRRKLLGCFEQVAEKIRLILDITLELKLGDFIVRL
jgi:hypothetical protein